jgi:dTDP-4-dehydrorhamnose 3,5-epimerase
MKFIKTAIKDVILIEPKTCIDDRGFFIESYKKSIFQDNGITDEFIQDNHSKSTANILRGLHYQLNPHAQAKLVRCIRGSIFDVAVDIRKQSPTFGKWVGYVLSEENKQMLYIPKGFAHGFITLSDAEVLYKTSAEYFPECDRGIMWNDPTINIDWSSYGVTDPILSKKDAIQPMLSKAEINF